MSGDLAAGGPSKPTLAALSATKVQTVDELVAVMRAIDGVLEPTDGLKWFNLLYLLVTENVQRDLHTQNWADQAWLERLDIAFAKLYLSALADSISQPDRTPYAWRPLFQARQDQRLLRIQFALAGMNAHINRDLCKALVQTTQQSFPGRDSSAYGDYCRVNALLEKAEAKAVQFLATGVIGLLDQALGNTDNIFAMWSVTRAREAAWINAEVLWHLRKLPILADQYFGRLDRMAGFAGRGLLQAVVPLRGNGLQAPAPTFRIPPV